MTRRLPLALLLLLAGPASAAASRGRGRARQGRPGGAVRPALPPRRPARGRPRHARGRHPGRSAHLLRGDGVGRRVEVGRTAASAGSRSSTTSRRARSARSRSRPRTRTWSTSAPARRTSAATSPPGNGIYKSTDAGQTWQRVWKQDGQIGTIVVHPRERRHRLRGRARQALRPEPRARRLSHARRRPHLAAGARQGRRHRRLRRRARPGATRGSSSPASGRRAGGRGSWSAAGRAAGSTCRATAATPGSSSPGTACPTAPGARSASPSRPPTPSASTRSSRPRRAASSARTTAARAGRLASDHHSLRQRAWYYSTLTVDPRNADVVWFPQVPLLRTIDGGRTIQRVKGPHHGDHHDVWIDPLRPAADDRRQRRRRRRLDGRRARPSTPLPLPISQFYHVAADSAVPYRVMGAMQDLGTAAGPERQPALERHHARRLARRRRRRGRLRRARPEGPRRRLRRRVPRHPHPLRPAHRAGAQRQSLAREHLRPRRRGRPLPLPVDGPDRRLAARPEARLLRRQRAVPHARTAARAGP